MQIISSFMARSLASIFDTLQSACANAFYGRAHAITKCFSCENKTNPQAHDDHQHFTLRNPPPPKQAAASPHQGSRCTNFFTNAEPYSPRQGLQPIYWARKVSPMQDLSNPRTYHTKAAQPLRVPPARGAAPLSRQRQSPCSWPS